MLELYNMSLADIKNYYVQNNKPNLPELNITILRNITLEPMEPYLKYLGLDIGFNTKITFGEFDNVIQDAMGFNSELQLHNADCIMVFLHIETLSSLIGKEITYLSPEEIENEKNRIILNIQTILGGLRKQTECLILWQAFEAPVYPSFGIIDSQTNEYHMGVVNSLNQELQLILKETSNAYLVDINLCRNRLGAQQFYDWRYWHIGRAPYSREAYREIACENFKYIRTLKGKNKKCLILDCDNTLWGGIIGEDGLFGIKLGTTNPGSGYREFQEEILSLYNRGVIIALCSKNNEDDVWEVFKNHPDMILKEEHIAAYKINWEDKASNIKLVAEELNIGLDSIVFIDDSEFEINLINEILPEVETLLLPKNQSYGYRFLLKQASGLFDGVTISNEDRQRGQMYRNEVLRKKEVERFNNIEDYLQSLEIEASVDFVDEFTIPRIAQLTQKTNQFNLTTKRYSDSEINKMSINQESDVLYIKVKDKFGDYGTVGVAILYYENETAYIDTFLLSCRVLGRKIEDTLLNQCIDIVRKKGITKIIGFYVPTTKNQQVCNFYGSRGFEIIDNTDGQLVYRLNLQD